MGLVFESLFVVRARDQRRRERVGVAQARWCPAAGSLRGLMIDGAGWRGQRRHSFRRSLLFFFLGVLGLGSRVAFVMDRLMGVGLHGKQRPCLLICVRRAGGARHAHHRESPRSHPDHARAAAHVVQRALPCTCS